LEKIAPPFTLSGYPAERRLRAHYRHGTCFPLPRTGPALRSQGRLPSGLFAHL